MKTLDWLCITLMIIGSVNWGLVGLFDFNLVTWLTGNQTNVFTRIIYCLIAIAGIVNILLLFAHIKLDKNIEERMQMHK